MAIRRRCWRTKQSMEALYMGKANDPDYEKEVITSSEELARPLEIMYRASSDGRRGGSERRKGLEKRVAGGRFGWLWMGFSLDLCGFYEVFLGFLCGF